MSREIITVIAPAENLRCLSALWGDIASQVDQEETDILEVQASLPQNITLREMLNELRDYFGDAAAEQCGQRIFIDAQRVRMQEIQEKTTTERPPVKTVEVVADMPLAA